MSNSVHMINLDHMTRFGWAVGGLVRQDVNDALCPPGPAGIGRGLFIWPRSLSAQQQEQPMPPYPIDPTAESVRDTARLGLNIPPSQTAMGIAVTSASGDASTAAPNEAASENSGAGPPGTPLQSLLRLLAGGWRAFQDCRRRERLRASLCGLSERELKDIGLTPGDIDHIVAFRAFETRRNDAMNPWPCRSVMQFGPARHDRRTDDLRGTDAARAHPPPQQRMSAICARWSARGRRERQRGNPGSRAALDGFAACAMTAKEQRVPCARGCVEAGCAQTSAAFETSADVLIGARTNYMP